MRQKTKTRKNKQIGRIKKTEFFNYPQKLSNCRQNFRLVLGLVGMNDAKGINKTTFFVFLALFGAYIGQPDGHIDSH